MFLQIFFTYCCILRYYIIIFKYNFYKTQIKISLIRHLYKIIKKNTGLIMNLLLPIIKNYYLEQLMFLILLNIHFKCLRVTFQLLHPYISNEFLFIIHKNNEFYIFYKKNLFIKFLRLLDT